MTQHDNTRLKSTSSHKTHPTRRQFLQQSLLVSLGASQVLHSPLSYSQSPQNSQLKTKSLANLDQDIVECVKRIRGEQDIQLTLLYPTGSLANLTPIITRFTQVTGITINPKEVGVDDINSSIIFKTTENKYFFDVALPATFGVADLAAANAIMPLDKWAERYEPDDYKQYQLYDYGDYVDGKFYGYQTDGDTYLMFYNKEWLDKQENKAAFEKQHGYALDIPQTWAQLDDMIRFFHKPEAQQYGGCLFRTQGYGAWEWWSRFHAKGYFPLDDNANPQINNAAGVEALQNMIDISTYLHPNTQTDGLFENWATFSEGNTFCNIGWGGSQKHFNSVESKVKNKLYYAPAPGGEFDGQTLSCPIFNWGWNYVVSSLCPHPEIAYLFTLYATSPVMSTIAVQQDGYFDPFREEHYSDSVIQTMYSNDFLTAHKQSMRDSIPDFYLLNQSSYLSVLQESIYLTYSGALSAQQALDVTATEWKILTARTGKQKQKGIWSKLKQKYPEKLRHKLKG